MEIEEVGNSSVLPLEAEMGEGDNAMMGQWRSDFTTIIGSWSQRQTWLR